MKTGQNETVLASSAGKYREQSPGAALAVHFRCTWSHSLPSDFDKCVAVVPDGCSDIVWSRQGLCVVGPDRTSAFPPLQAGETVIGIRFQAGAAAKWLNLSMAEITGETVALSDLWGSDAQRLQEQLCEIPSVAGKLALLQSTLQQRAADVTAPCPDMHRAFDHLARQGGDGTVETLSRTLGYGERTFRRHCLEHFGYGPKTLKRILRFQRLLGLLRTNRREALSMLALDAGYADQAHMSREAQMLAGFSPAEIRRQLAA